MTSPTPRVGESPREPAWNEAMQRSIWRLRDQGLNAREIAARFEGVTKHQIRQFIQSGNPPASTEEIRNGER